MLFEIKNSSQKLEDVLKEVSQHYSKELCQVIRAMLRYVKAIVNDYFFVASDSMC